MVRYTLPATGKIIATEADILDVIGETYGTGADEIVIPVARLSSDFYQLSTGLAGAILQKVTNYGFRVAIVGDISAELKRSTPLRDFVRESNKRGQTRFVASESEL
ncbi:MAG: DUF4180 domain-containing protein [Devosia sp.]